MKFQTATDFVKRFEEMNLPSELLTALDKMNITKPTDVQSQAIPLATTGSDFVAVAQTGSGKTLAFGLSILSALNKKSTSRALVLAPSREMATQIHKVLIELCRELPVTTCLAIGGAPGQKQANQLKRNPRIIVATPGRLYDHLLTNKLLLQNVELVVIDEADRMLDMGFAPQLKNIRQTIRTEVQTLMFSATFNQPVEAIAELFLKHKSFMIRSEQAEAPVGTLKQKVLFIDRKNKDDRLLDELNATKGGVIVFAGSQQSCERLGDFLKSYGYEMDMIHGGLSQGHRNRVVREFRNGEIRIVVATDLLARGLDVPHVDHVINFDLPFSPEDFLHRIGRTARAGRAGTAITFVTESDSRMYLRIKPYLQDAEEIKVDSNFLFPSARHAQENTKKRVDKYQNKAAAKPRIGGRPIKRPGSKPTPRPKKEGSSTIARKSAPSRGR